MEDLTGKVAVVTGGGSGIGKALALALAGEGAKVAVVDVDSATLDATVDDIAHRGGTAVGVQADVGDADDVQRTAADVVSAFGGVDILCNNAGIMNWGPAPALSLEAWERVLRVNLWGVINGIRVFWPLLVERGAGHIVNTASIAGLFSSPFLAPYNASKAAVISISESLAQEALLLGLPIQITVVCPGVVNTNIASEGRQGGSDSDPVLGMLDASIPTLIADGVSPEAVAEDVIIAIRENRFYTFPGTDGLDQVRQRFDAIEAGQVPAMALDEIRRTLA